MDNLHQAMFNRNPTSNEGEKDPSWFITSFTSYFSRVYTPSFFDEQKE